MLILFFMISALTSTLANFLFPDFDLIWNFCPDPLLRRRGPRQTQLIGKCSTLHSRKIMFIAYMHTFTLAVLQYYRCRPLKKENTWRPPVTTHFTSTSHYNPLVAAVQSNYEWNPNCLLCFPLFKLERKALSWFTIWLLICNPKHTSSWQCSYSIITWGWM